MAGLTVAGFVSKSATDIKAEYDAAFKQLYGASLGSEPDGSIPAASSIGQEIALLTDADSAAWQLAQAIYSAFDPDSAVTPQLQVLCALTGTRQESATFSTVVETCIGVAGTVLPAGRAVTVQTTGTRFTSQALATLALVSDTWAALTDYAVNDLIINGGRVWQVSVAGTSSAGTPPTGAVGAVVTEGTVTWRAMANSTQGVALVPFAATVVGPLSASAGTLINIATPVTGWVSAYNLADADLGAALQSEPSLRALRVAQLQSSGGGPADAIRAAILRIPTVENCVVFVNDGDTVDGDGVPAHGVEVLIQAPSVSPTTDAELALAVWQAVGAGIATGGGITETVTDASGYPQTVKFSRPEPVPIYIAAQVVYLISAWPGGDDAVIAAAQSAIGTLFSGFPIGFDVRSANIAAAIIDGPQEVNAAGAPVIPATVGSQAAPGILGVNNGAGTDGTLPYIGKLAAPVTSTTVTITLRQLATVAVLDMDITALGVTSA